MNNTPIKGYENRQSIKAEITDIKDLAEDMKMNFYIGIILNP